MTCSPGSHGKPSQGYWTRSATSQPGEFWMFFAGPGTWRKASRGANAEGIDFAKAMVEKAAHNYPHVLFRDGDAENLPYGNEEFDALVCLFGILYVERG